VAAALARCSNISVSKLINLILWLRGWLRGQIKKSWTT